MPKPNGGAETRKPSDEFRSLELGIVVPSKTNPRKKFDGPEFDELVASIAKSGVLVPILVRQQKAQPSSPLGKLTLAGTYFEVVAGERRLRAAQKAGLVEIPALVRSMTDDEAMEAQIVENLQRKDVEPLDEARGFRVLLDRMVAAQPKASVDGKIKPKGRQELIAELAARLGKSPRYVWARMKLTELQLDAQKKLEAGEIEASHADELVRLAPGDQQRCLKFLFQHRDADEGARSVRELKAFIADDILHDLAGAPWKKDDPKLLPAAGACSGCEKRTGAHPELHPEAKRDLCLDSDCFAAKRKAFVELQIQAAASDANAAKGKNAEEALKAGTDKARTAAASALQVLRISHLDGHWHSELSPGEQKRTLFKGYSYEPGYVECKPGDCEYASPAVFVEGSRTAQRTTVCAVQKCGKHFRTRESGSGRSVTVAPTLGQRQATRRNNAADRLKTDIRFAVAKAVMEAAPASPGVEELRHIAAGMLGRLDHSRKQSLLKFFELEALKKTRHGYTNNDVTAPLKKKLAEATNAKQIFGLMFVFAVAEALANDLHYETPDKQRLYDLAGLLKVNVKSIGTKLADASAARIRELEAKENKAAAGSKKQKPTTKGAKEHKGAKSQTSAGKKAPAKSAMKKATKKAGRK